MDSIRCGIRIDGNPNNNINNSEMEDAFDTCTDNQEYLYKPAISKGFINEEPYDTDNKHNYVTIKDENIDDQMIVDFINEKPCDMKYKQGSIGNYVSIKHENIDDLNIVIANTQFETDCTDNKMCLNKTANSRGYIKQELSGIKVEQGNVQNYPSMKDENIDDLTVVAQETQLVTDYIDNKICVYETIISGGYIKEEPCDTGNESGSIHNVIDIKDCEKCGEEYDLYCLKCSMLIRIFDSSNQNGTDNVVRQTLPKNFLDICETQSGWGIVALRAIPKGVVFGPFRGLNLTKDEVISKWKLKNNELDVTNDPERLNWMQYIRRADKSSHQNLVPFQYEDRLYYRSECHVNVGDELLVGWDSEGRESEIQDTEKSYWAPGLCERLDDSYACTFCCVGYKLISHLKVHNSTCIDKRNKNDFCKEIVQCDICKIYLDMKEYSDYHMDRCYKSNGKCVFSSPHSRNRGQPLHTSDRPFSCALCRYKATTKSNLKQHVAIHDDDKPFACTLCPYKTKINSDLKRHIAVHNDDRPFACPFCPYKAARKWVLNKHIFIHTGDKPFACTLCPYKAKTKSNLKQHVAIHDDDKPFACTFCPYKTKINSDLKRHIAVHNDDRPFACTLCPYKATRGWILKKHITFHNDDKPFACTLCPYKAKTQSRLKQHITIHDGEKPFACSLCPYKTKVNCDLKRHIAVHNDDRPFACPFCPYKAARKWVLKKHIFIHTGDKKNAEEESDSDGSSD